MKYPDNTTCAVRMWNMSDPDGHKGLARAIVECFLDHDIAYVPSPINGDIHSRTADFFVIGVEYREMLRILRGRFFSVLTSASWYITVNNPRRAK
jgi:hypothetical protein